MQVCKYNQKEFCKYREQCTQKHINQICYKHPSCDEQGCESHHPALCRIYERFVQCKFTKCAYSHKRDEKDQKMEALQTEVIELKESVTVISDECETLNVKLVRYDKMYEDIIDESSTAFEDLKVRISSLENTSKKKDETPVQDSKAKHKEKLLSCDVLNISVLKKVQ